MDLGPSQAADINLLGDPLPEVTWIQPIPDDLAQAAFQGVEPDPGGGADHNRIKRLEGAQGPRRAAIGEVGLVEDDQVPVPRRRIGRCFT